MTAFRIGDIQPNPFRDIDNYPYREKTIEALRASYRNTSVWPTIVARLTDGKPEIAFGHHRLEAARREFGEDGTIPLNIQPLDDATMLRMMANENMEEYASAASVAQETVRQVVLAYAAGKIELDEPPALSTGNLRYAPSFLLGATAGSRPPYTAVTIATFLGWSADKVQRQLGALEETELGTFTPADFHGLTQEQARAAVTSVRAAERIATHRKVAPGPVKEAAAKAAISAAKRGAGHEKVREEAEQAIEAAAPPKIQPAVPKAVAKGLTREIEGFFRVAVPINGKPVTRADLIRLIAANRNAEELQGINLSWAEELALALDEMAQTALAFVAILRAEDAVEAL